MQIEITNEQVEALRMCLEDSSQMDEYVFTQLESLYNTAVNNPESKEGKSITEIFSLLYSPLNVKVKLPEWGGYWCVDEHLMLTNEDGTLVEPARIAEFADRRDWIIIE